MRLPIKISVLLLVVAALGWASFRAGGSPRTPDASLSANTAEAGPNWQSWDDAYAVAKKKKRIVLVDLYTDWCGWCKKLDKDTYANAEVIEAIKQNFEAVKLNPEKGTTYNYEGKKITGSELVQRLNSLGGGVFRGYPTTVFIVPNNKGEDTVYMVSGYYDPNQYKQLLSQIVQQSKAAPRG